MVGAAARAILPDGGTTSFPVKVEGTVNRAPGGGVDADGVEASVAGIPAGPFAELMVQAVLEPLGHGFLADIDHRGAAGLVEMSQALGHGYGIILYRPPPHNRPCRELRN